MRSGVVSIAGAAAVALAVGALSWAGGSARPDGSSDGASRTHRVEIRQFAFEPERLEVAVGDTVVWLNADAVPHTATAPDSAWSSPRLDRDGHWRRVFTRPGTHKYRCAYHPGMRGTIAVLR